jgi:pimeloyl-ACP methyl ester carboxylesterase
MAIVESAAELAPAGHQRGYMHTLRVAFRVAGLILILQAGPYRLTAQARAPGTDPVTSDPPRPDSANPASLAELEIESMGARMNGLFYLASGPGPHPVVVLLHGFPGNERNLDLAQAIRRAGINALFFSYRGAWGSGGRFSFANALEDVAAAVHFARSDESAQQYHSDPGRVALLGHSMGGWLAILGAAADSSIRCTGALDYWNVGSDGRLFRADKLEDSLFTAYVDWLTARGGPLQADGGRTLTSEIKEHAEAWDVDSSAKGLRSRPVLLISTTANPYRATFIAALESAGARKVTAVNWKSDHSFSALRIKLARTVVEWLHRSCGF